jgi:hypothetical protein
MSPPRPLFPGTALTHRRLRSARKPDSGNARAAVDVQDVQRAERPTGTHRNRRAGHGDDAPFGIALARSVRIGSFRLSHLKARMWSISTG